jgi:hypothetical protein
MTMGGFCCVALSDFLHRFATKTMAVPRTFLPIQPSPGAVYPVTQTCPGIPPRKTGDFRSFPNFFGRS